MAMILHIETASPVCSVALGRDGELLHVLEDDGGRSHGRLLTVLIDQLLRDADSSPGDLDAIAVSVGPGSYTGLRIGLSAAKGMAYALDRPLIGLSSLDALADAVKTDAPHILTTMDSRRNELYAGLYDTRGDAVTLSGPVVLEEDWFAGLPDGPIAVAGTGWHKLAESTHADRFEMQEDLRFSAVHLVPAAHRKHQRNDHLDLAYSAPDYMKPFISGGRSAQPNGASKR